MVGVRSGQDGVFGAHVEKSLAKAGSPARSREETRNAIPLLLLQQASSALRLLGLGNMVIEFLEGEMVNLGFTTTERCSTGLQISSQASPGGSI